MTWYCALREAHCKIEMRSNFTTFDIFAHVVTFVEISRTSGPRHLYTVIFGLYVARWLAPSEGVVRRQRKFLGEPKLSFKQALKRAKLTLDANFSDVSITTYRRCSRISAALVIG